MGKLCKKLSTEYEKENKTQNIFDKKYKEEIENINKLKIPLFDINEIVRYKNNSEAAGFSSVDFIENKLNVLIREKKGNDGSHYKNPCNHT